MAKVGDSISAPLSSWTFGGEVCVNFDDHVSKSVPGYEEGHLITSRLSDFFINCHDTHLIVDIGCSTGALLNKIHQRHSDAVNIKYIGIDSVEEMISFADSRKHINSSNIEYININLLDAILPAKASFITSYYTMQFIHPSVRQDAFDWVYNSLNWGGGFILFEKIRMPDARFQDYLNQTYIEYKLSKGYTHEEILGKALSLKGVLEPFSMSGNIELLQRAGFHDIVSVYQNMCFMGWLAIK